MGAQASSRTMFFFYINSIKMSVNEKFDINEFNQNICYFLNCYRQIEAC